MTDSRQNPGGIHGFSRKNLPTFRQWKSSKKTTLCEIINYQNLDYQKGREIKYNMNDAIVSIEQVILTDDIKERIKHTYKSNGTSRPLSRIGENTCVVRDTVYSWIRDKNPRKKALYEKVKAFCEYYGVSVEYILTGEEMEEKE